MKLIARIIEAVKSPFRRAASDDAAQAAVQAPAGKRLASVRSRVAPMWRALIRVAIVAGGLGLFAFAQYGVAFLINHWQWYLIAAAYILLSVFVFSFWKPTHMFVFWLVSSPLVYFFFSGDLGAGLPKITFDRLALPLIACSLVMRVAAGRIKVRRPILGEILLFAFVVYAGLNISLFHPFRMETFNPYLEFIVLAGLAYFVAKVVLLEKKHVEWAVIALTVLGLMNAAVLAIEAHTGHIWYSWIIGRNIPLQWADVGQGRGQGLFNIPHVTQIYCSMMAFMAIHLMKAARNWAAKLFYCACVVIQILAIYLAYSRSGYVAIAIMFLLMPIFTLASRKTYMLLTASAMILLAALMPFFLSNRDFVSRMSSDTASIRFKINDSNINLIKHNLWLGVGYSRVQEAFDQYVTSIGHRRGLIKGNENTLQVPNKPHNWHLQVLGEEGLVGGFFYYGSIVAFLIYMLRLRHRLPKSGILGTNCVTVLLVGTLANLFSLNLYGGPKVPYPVYVFWIVFAIAVRLGELTSDESRSAAPEIAAPSGATPVGRQMVGV